MAKKPAGYLAKRAKERKAKMGPISRDQVYSDEKLMALAGWGRSAWRKAIDTGLDSYRHGKITYVTGEAYFRWIEERAKASREAAEEQS